MNLEQTILRNILEDSDYTKLVLPFIQTEYFSDTVNQNLFNSVRSFILKYNKPPTIETLTLHIEESTELRQTEIDTSKELLDQFKKTKPNPDVEWLIEQTEEFCKKRALYNAIKESIVIMDDEKRAKGEIETVLTDALSVTFDTRIGHSYFDDAEDRFEFYHKKDNRLPFDIEILNRITNGGLPNKTLSIILAGVNVGKSLTMCHVSAAALLAGKNVLYITLEMAEESITQRIDANILDIEVNDIVKLSKDDFLNRIQTKRKKTNGKLIVREYASQGASALTIKGLLNELRLKQNFIPDLICLDYLNIAASSKIRLGGSINTNTYIKNIAEEFRALAKEKNLPILTAAQFNREGMSSTEPDMTDIADSIGITATADLILGIVSTDELSRLNQLKVIQLKSRLGDKNRDNQFVLGIDRLKFRLYDCEQSASSELVTKKISDEQEKPKVEIRQTGKRKEFVF